MRPLLATALAASVLLVPAPARAAVTDPTGALCDFAGVNDDTVTFWAGPLNLVDEDDPATVHAGTVTCSIREWNAHSAPEWLAVTSPPGAGHALLPPTTLPQPGEYPQWYALCTRVDVAGTTLYWHARGRNTDGYWSADPRVPCELQAVTTDLQPDKDQPGGTVFSAAATAFGEVDGVACAATGCPGPAPVGWMSSVSILRLPGAGAVLRTMPSGWTCTDARTGATVLPGSALGVPEPAVACAPPALPRTYCSRVEVSGALLPTGTGRVAVTASCGTGGWLTVSRRLTPTQGTVVRPWSKEYGATDWPLRCALAEDVKGPAGPAYAVSCSVFANPSG